MERKEDHKTNSKKIAFAQEDTTFEFVNLKSCNKTTFSLLVMIQAMKITLRYKNLIHLQLRIL